MKAGHDGADRNVEDLSRVRVTELAYVDEDDDVPEVVRDRGQRLRDVVLREPLDDALLLGLAARRLVRQSVVEPMEPALKARLANLRLEL